jgi:predicted DNA binding protein
MQYLDLVISPTNRAVHPIDSFIRSRAGVRRESLLHIDARPDGTTVLLYRLSGDHAGFAEALAAREEVTDHEVVDVPEGAEGEFHAFIQASGTGDSALLGVAHEHALIIDTPLVFCEEGTLCATFVGTHENLRNALATMPAELDFRVDDAGPYAPGSEDLLSPLTDRQLEVFKTAVDEGYYDVPRRATHKDIADSLGCAPSTVDEHLRKAESRVVTGLLG